jgi:hypothetical protein
MKYSLSFAVYLTLNIGWAGTIPPVTDESVTVRTQDTGVALENPGMGWTMHFYSNVPANYGSKLSPADTLDDFPGLSTVYLRLPLSRCVTLRDDSILVQPPPNSWYHAEMAQDFWPKFPVILEHEHYGGSKNRGAWSGELLLKSVEDYHASFMSIHGWPREFLAENREMIDLINQRMGYRLQPLAVTWPRTLEIAGPMGQKEIPQRFTVHWTWANKGVAPCYPGGFPCLTLKDADGGIVSVLSDESLDMRSLQVGPPGAAPVTTLTSEFTIGLVAPTTHPGTYDLFISVGTRDGTPQIALPLTSDDSQRRYRLCTVTLQNPGKD